MPKGEDNRTAFEKVEDALRWFWRKNSGATMMKAKNAEFIVEPKVFIAGKINPQIAELVIKRYLEKVAPEDVLEGRVAILEDRIVINDDQGKKLLEVKNKKIIEKMTNRLTDMIGLELAEKASKSGAPYLKEGIKEHFSFGDIKDALVDFMADMEKCDSKNLVRDAVLLIGKGEGYSQLVSPAKTEKKAL